MDEPFLTPIEKPKRFLMKLVYFFSKRRIGKVITPLKVQYSRLPLSFALFSTKISVLDKKLQLPVETVILIRAQVARINICLFCIDIARALLIKESMNEAKFDALDQYNSSPHFSESDKAALDYVTELTRDKKIRPETFARLARHYSERAICEIVWIVASEHVYNMTNIGLNIHSDMLCDIRMQRKLSR